jgi:S1-C subfamily serine protease
VLKDLSERLKLEKKQTGFRITRIYPRTVAATADLKVGDVITHLNGKRIYPRRVEDTGVFYRAVKRLDIDDDAELTLVRNAKPLEVKLKLEPSRLRRDEVDRNQNHDFEITVREVTFFDRVDNRWEQTVRGVIVEQAEPAGWAGLGGVRRGDLIQGIDDFEITDLETYEEAITKLTDSKPKRIVFFVLRGVRTRFLYVEPQWSPEYKGKDKAEDKPKETKKEKQ